MTVLLAKKTILAKLLARENITVEQTNHPTAFFDVEKRILGLPFWKDVGKDLYDLLVGHEIGHALHTPADGWHSSDTYIPGCPRSYVNVIEDIRIEKLVLREYPGLLSSFKRGYQDLLDRDFFGLKDNDVNKMSFMNRVNIYSKSRGLVDVRFSSKEQPYVDRAMAVETWKDVIDSCREIYEFMKEQLENSERQLQEQDTFDQEQNGLDDGDGSFSRGEGKGGEGTARDSIPDKIVLTADKPKGGKTSSDISKELHDAIKNGDVKIEVDVDSFIEGEVAQKEASGENSVKAETEIDSLGGYSNEISNVETDAVFRNAIAKALVDSINAGGSTLFVKGPTKEQTMASTSSYQELKESRDRTCGRCDYPEKHYIKFLSNTKQVVSVMVKEFEMRKTARRFARARQSMKGSIDVNMLHKYKYDDAIFKQVTHLDDDQSHGVMMMIDYSGSMDGLLPKVIKQLLILTTFCKRVNIPFEVYAFTNPNNANVRNRHNEIKQSLTSIRMDTTHLFKLIDSSMNKKVYEEAFRALFAQTTSFRRAWRSHMEELQGTPLDTSIMAMYHHIAAFRAKHNVQKMNFITLTDGKGDGIHVVDGIDIDRYAAKASKTRVLDIMGQRINIPYYDATQNLLDGIRKMGVKTINYHLIRPANIKYEIRSKSVGEMNTAIAKMKKDNYCIFENLNGYDHQIFTALSTGDVGTDDDDYDEDTFNKDVKTIAKAFTNKALKKKHDRLIAANFAAIIS